MTQTMESRNVMANVKDWLQNKCRDTGLLKSVDNPPLHSGHQLTYSNLVITPNNIPKFIIPSSMEPARNGSVSLLDTDLHSQSSSGGSMTSASGLPGSYAGPRHVWGQQPAVRSAPNTLRAPSTPYEHEESFSGSNSSHTNSDPMSLAALSLPHLKKHSLYGFETLTEMPRTCKESLFHDGSSRDEGSQGLPLTRRTSKRDKSSSQQTSTPQIRIEDVDRGTSCRQYHKRQHNRTAVIAPLGNVLSNKLSVPSFQSSSCQGRREDNIKELGYRPICGLHATDNCCNCLDNKTNGTKNSQHSISSFERQQHQHQDNLKRASLTGVNLHCRNCLLSSSSLQQTNQGDPNMTKRPSSGSASSGYGSCSSCQSVLQNSEAVSSSSSSSSSSKGQRIGQVRLNLLYLPEQQQLKVGLIQVKDLTSSNTDTPSNNRLKHSQIDSPPTKQTAQQLNPFVKLCLMPGKGQRHVSKVVRHTQNPVFNQNFIFNHLERHEVAKKSLRLKVYHKKAKLCGEELLGELMVSMAELIPSKVVTLLRELEPVSSRHKLGYIYLSVCFYPSTEKLTVGVHQVTDLTRQTFTGAPDPYVRVELSQVRRSSTRQQTKTKKNTDHVFNETFTFGISPKLEDLQYTCLTVTVLDHSTLLADKEIGQVCLGLDATEEAEFHHWNQVLQRPGYSATSWHILMHPYSS